MKPLFETMADVLFPPFCVSCHEPGAWWCAGCQEQAEPIRGAICPACLAIGPHNCAPSLPFNQIISFGYYHDPRLRSVVTALKFQGATALMPALLRFIQEHAVILKQMALTPETVIIPVPLAKKRLKERGFNQAELIAECLKNALGLPYEINTRILERSEARQAQSSLEHHMDIRRGNIAGVFACSAHPPENIWLIDDVATTGATAAEAAYCLLRAGAKRISLITLAIGA